MPPPSKMQVSRILLHHAPGNVQIQACQWVVHCIYKIRQRVAAATLCRIDKCLQIRTAGRLGRSRPC